MSPRVPEVEVVTFGCRLNIVESEAMRHAALAAGQSNLVIVNSCAVTAEATRQARQTIRRVGRERQGVRIVVTGCAAETAPEDFAGLAGVERLIPNATKTAPDHWGGVAPSGLPGFGLPGFGPEARDGGHTRSFVEIQNGCDHDCTFCIIPFGRGRSRSLAPDAIVTRLRHLVEAGVQEAVLTGVDVTSYAAEGLTLGGLIKRLLRDVPDLPRLRLSSIDCIETDADMFDCIADEPRFMPHLHLSLQSGADLILKRMKRRHSRADALAFCRQARALRPDMVLGADVIAGFPTETEDHAAETEALLAECGITHLHVFPYSARPGTPAARMPPVSGHAIKARAARLRALGEQALHDHLAAQVGRRLRVLTERGGRGRAEDFTAVLVPGIAAGAIVDVAITGHTARDLTGSVLSGFLDRGTMPGSARLKD